ncbi:hypothetical protein OHQ88_33490 (plasmid) [Micromonospora zamorensis]|uniref:hypothetical protein n=1 Tax=Micromonospora zamorensis TaxID=709883 RepID=UPI002E1A4652
MRVKWFAPRDGGQPYKPLGIDCEGAATLYGHRAGWNRADTGTSSPADEARRNQDFWMNTDRPASDPGTQGRQGRGRPAS